MARQGCRNHRLLPFFCFAIALFGAFSFGASVQAAEAEQQAVNDANWIDLRLELTWNSESPRYWAGDIYVAGSTELRPESNRLSEPGNLTSGMLLTGGVHLTPERDFIRFSPSQSVAYLRDRSGHFVAARSKRGGISFRVKGHPGERVVFAFRRDDSNETASPIAIALEDLQGGNPIESKFTDSATWAIRRRENDSLRITLSPKQSETASPEITTPETVRPGTALFWDDQQAQIALQCDIHKGNDVPSWELVCETFDFGTGNRSIATHVCSVSLQNGIGLVTDSAWQPPKGDGCYELHWKLRRKTTPHSVMGVPLPGSISESITNPMSLIRGATHESVIAESKSTVVVLSRQARTESLTGSSKPFVMVGRIEPLGRSWSLNNYLPIREATRFVSQGSGSTSHLIKSTIAGKQVAELAPGRFSIHGLPIAKKGVRHRVRVHLPNGQAMKLGVCLLDTPNFGGRPVMVRDFTCIRTRQKTNDSPWVTAEIDFYPQSDTSQLMLINRDKQLAANFEAIDVSVLDESEDKKPTEPNPNTSASRPTASRTALMQLDTDQWLATYGDLLPPQRGGNVHSGNAFVAAIRLVEAIRREGYGGVMLTVCEDGRTLFPTASMTADMGNVAGMPISEGSAPETLELLLRLFDRESLVLLPCVRPNFPMTVLEQAIAGGAATGRGISLVNPWNGQNLELSLSEVESACVGIYNPTNEAVGAQIIALTQELAAVCAEHSCVKTIGMIADEGSCLCLPHARLSLDSSTLDRFHASLPAETVARSQVVAWVNNEGAPAFEKWREEQLRKLYQQLLLTATAGDKNLMVATTMDQPPVSLLSDLHDSRLIVSRLYRRSQIEPLSARCRDEHTTGSPSPVSASLLSGQSTGDSTHHWASPTAMFITPISSVEPTAGDLEMLLRCGRKVSPITTTAMVDTEGSSLITTKLLGRSDHTCIAISGMSSGGDNDVRRRSLARFQGLPPTVMDEVTPADEAMRFAKLRRAVYQGATFFVATNHSRWPITITASLMNASGLQSVLPSDAPLNINADGVWFVSLAPGELAAVRVAEPNARVQVWSAQIEGGETRAMEIGNMMRELADLLAATAEPKSSNLIENASFEDDQSSRPKDATTPSATDSIKVGSNPLNVTGWMVAQHPVGAAGIDDEVALEGKRSIRLSNRDGRPGGTWIVSRPIETPSSGRIALSLMVRGEPSESPESSKPIIVRFAIEGSVAGSSFRQSRLITVTRNGQWSSSPYRIEIDSLPRCGVESLRLAIDVMNEGTVWIDDVKSEDSFMTAAEKSHLQSQVFLAIGGITKGELSPAVKLLESHWIQQILGSPTEPTRPTMASSKESLQRVGAKNEKSATEPSRPGIAERLKGWLPRSIRF